MRPWTLTPTVSKSKKNHKTLLIEASLIFFLSIPGELRAPRLQNDMIGRGLLLLAILSSCGKRGAVDGGGMTGKLYLMRWFWWKKERERKRAAAVRDVTAGGSAPRTATHTSFNCSGGRGRMEWIHLHLWHIQSLVTENQTDCEKQQESLWEIMMWWFIFLLFFFFWRFWHGHWPRVSWRMGR